MLQDFEKNRLELNYQAQRNQDMQRELDHVKSENKNLNLKFQEQI